MIGDAVRRLKPLVQLLHREGADGGPVSQETTSDRQADKPSWKGVAPMPHTKFLSRGVGALAAVTAIAAGAVPALAGSAPNHVSIRIEGKTKTLLPQSVVAKVPATVTMAGHSCPGASGAGVLQAATKGRWAGTYSSSFKDFLVTKILGETDIYAKTKSYWALFVNHVMASTGICGVKLKRGEQLLFASVGATETPGLPLGITVSGTIAKVVYYTAKGAAVAAPGVTVKSGTTSTKTNAAGKATLPAYSKPTTVTASKKGYIRAEALAG